VKVSKFSQFSHDRTQQSLVSGPDFSRAEKTLKIIRALAPERLLQIYDHSMNLCDQCGSASRDMSGFCKGCGAPWPLTSTNDSTISSALRQVETPSMEPTQIGATGLLYAVGTKQVWVAVALALLFGPLGLLYCTITGAIVMMIVSVALALILGQLSFLITFPICAIWAWRASREMTSAFD
jgi:hypothetical protein